MCGIYCVLRQRRAKDTSDVFCKDGAIQHAALRRAVQRRGPDDCASVEFSASPSVSVEAMSAVLRMRGDGEVVRQPALVRALRGEAHDCCSRPAFCPSFLQWNGEVFGGSMQLSSQASDTNAILNCLHQLECDSETRMNRDAKGTEDLRAAALTRAQASFAECCMQFLQDNVEGPYAFVYYASSLQMFLFGRDPLGRRSLLTHVAAVRAAAPRDGGDAGGDDVTHEVVLEVIISSVTAAHVGGRCAVKEPAENPWKRLRLGSSVHGNKNGGDDVNDDDDDDDDDNATPASSDNCCWQELPNTGLFVVSVVPSLLTASLLFSHCPWTAPHGTHPLLRFRSQPHLKMMLEEKGGGEAREEEEHHQILGRLLYEGGARSHPLLQGLTSFEMQATIHYIRALWKAVVVRTKADHSGGDPTCPVGVLFSGGIDCTVLAAIAHYALPLTTPIELVNVAFGETPELTPDRLATFKAFEQLLQLQIPVTSKREGSNGDSLQEGREWRLVLVDVPYDANNSHVQGLICPGNSVIDMSIGSALWHAAQGRGRMQRVRASDEVSATIRARALSSGHHKLYRVSSDNMKSFKEENLSSTDSNVETGAKFAPLVDAIVTELEAFGGASASAPVLLSTLGKDHATALRPVLARYKYKKLGQYLNDAFTAGVVAFARRDEAPSKAVRLVRPVDMARVRHVVPAKWLLSGMDEGSPLGSCVSDYTCEARVLLLGMGADETLGGYTRHRRAFQRRGVQGLAAELGGDFARLWKRNLGRDDRVVCDSGREGRYPYLDEGVLRALAAIAARGFHGASAAATGSGSSSSVTSVDGDVALQQALEPVCCFSTVNGAPGVGDKKILRRCAAMLGLGDVVHLQKRAIQFGSRVACAPL